MFNSQKLRNLEIELMEMDLAVFSQEFRNLEIELTEMDLALFSSQELRNLEI